MESFSVNLGSNQKEVDLHSLPCEIKYNGRSDVSTFFKPFDHPDLTNAAGFHGSNVQQEASEQIAKGKYVYFRGRRLKARETDLQDCTAVILERKKNGWQCGGKIKNFNVWELPNYKRTKIENVLTSWKKTAKMIHDPILYV